MPRQKPYCVDDALPSGGMPTAEEIDAAITAVKVRH